jgi:thymidine kinase
MRDESSAESARDGESRLGSLRVICGPMFAGKTTRLIALLRDAHDRGLSAAAVKPVIDTRYHPTDISAHTGLRLPAITIRTPAELLGVDAMVVGLDEAHFFEAGLHEAVMALVGRGSEVILAGLDRTSTNEPFGEMAALLIEADEVEKVKGACAICGRDAVHTVRLVPWTERIVVGGAGMFENRCRLHLNAPAAAGQR